MSKIQNHVEVMHALSRCKTLQPDGDEDRTIVDNPRASRDSPDYLRLSVPRKACNFKVIEQARQFDLLVKDVWQYDDAKNKNRVEMIITKESNL